MRIQTVVAEHVLLSVPGYDEPNAVAVIPQTEGVRSKATRMARNAVGPTEATRREVLAEALLDGFLGAENADYGKLVKFVERLRDHSPALAVQLLKPLLRTEATPTVNVEQQAIFIFGDVPGQSQPDNKTEAIDV